MHATDPQQDISIWSSHGEKKDAAEIQHSELADLSASTTTEIKDGIRPTSTPKRLERYKRSFLRKGPLLGLTAILFTLLSIPPSLLILWMSNGREVTSWKIQPTVYLAILTAIGNSAIRLAAIQGAMVVWWSYAMRGTTYLQLYYDWKMSFGAFGAISAGRRTNFIAIASFCAALVVVDGPLLQRASSVSLKVPGTPVELQALLAPEIPAHFTGVMLVNDQNAPVGVPGAAVDFSNDFLSTFRNYTAGVEMSQTISGCPGECLATVQAAALSLVSCNSTSSPINFTTPFSAEEQAAFDDDETVPYNRTAFNIAIYETLDEVGDERIVLYYGATDAAVSKSCVGHYIKNYCQFAPGIAEYDVRISNNTITFVEPPSNPKMLQLANNTRITNETIIQENLRVNANNLKTALGGIAAAGATNFYTFVGLVPSSPGHNPFTTTYDRFAFDMTTNYEAWDNQTDCAPAWKDTTQQILTTLNELMFRTSIYTAATFNESYLKSLIDEGLNVSTTVHGKRIDPVNVFQVNYYYYLAAALIEFLAAFVIFIAFHGWWRLGRDVSFSPLEIAKAFDAPLLRDVESNSSAIEIARRIGERKITYGVLDEDKDGKGRRLGFADAEVVEHASTF
ncbi:MAG: hypothetical protein Q9157_005662 [Trypethelium eluteriae]